MAFGHVEHLEIVVIQFYLRAAHHVETHTQKDLFQLVQHQLEWVAAALGRAFAGQGNVQRFVCQAGVQRRVGQLFHAGADVRVNVLPHLVGKRADHGALLGAQAAHLLQDGRHLALFAQKAHPKLVHGLFVRGSGEQLIRCAADLFQCLSHGPLSFSESCAKAKKKAPPLRSRDEAVITWPRGTTHVFAV